MRHGRLVDRGLCGPAPCATMSLLQGHGGRLMQQPEQQARITIDERLTAAGWLLQDRDAFDRHAALGVAVREFFLPNGPCDYLLFIDGKAAGVIEAKKTGVTLRNCL